MFSKVSTRVNQLTNLTGVTARSFRATVAANNTKKPSIGDAVTILQSKVSGINQVVSTAWDDDSFGNRQTSAPAKIAVHKNAPCRAALLNRARNEAALFQASLSCQLLTNVFFMCVERSQGIRIRYLHRWWYRQSLRSHQGASRWDGGIQVGSQGHGSQLGDWQRRYCHLGQR